MVLYTPLAMEDIFAVRPEDNPAMEIVVNGRLCLVRRGSDGTPRLERLLSTDPNDYLRMDFQPQTIIRF